MELPLTLAKVLAISNELPWNEALYLPQSDRWTLESSAIVWDPDDVACDEDEVPEIAARNGMRYVLGISDVRGVVINAREQKPDCTLDELFDAFMYYFEHDAFTKLV